MRHTVINSDGVQTPWIFGRWHEHTLAISPKKLLKKVTRHPCSRWNDNSTPCTYMDSSWRGGEDTKLSRVNNITYAEVTTFTHVTVHIPPHRYVERCSRARTRSTIPSHMTHHIFPEVRIKPNKVVSRYYLQVLHSFSATRTTRFAWDKTWETNLENVSIHGGISRYRWGRGAALSAQTPEG